MVSTILIFDLQMINKSMNNNYKRGDFGIQRFEYELSWTWAKSVEIFT
jgi:hypothetical protein